MIDLISSSMCRDCFALKTALQHEGIAPHEIDIKSLGPDELGEIEAIAKLKLVALRIAGQAMKLEALMSTPMIRAYPGGNPFILFPCDLLAGGVVTREGVEAIRELMRE